jgi:hypothetical protein
VQVPTLQSINLRRASPAASGEVLLMNIASFTFILHLLATV